MKSKFVWMTPLFLLSALLFSLFIYGCDDDCESNSSTRFPQLEHPPLLGSTSYDGPETHNNAAAVFWNKLLWVFYSTEDSSSNEIHYKTWNGSSMTDTFTLKTGSDIQHTQALTTPIVANKVMYLFITGTGGKLDYAYLDPKDNQWKGLYRVVNDDILDPGTRYAAVYNTLHQWIEVYWIPNGDDDIYYACLDIDKAGYPSGSWHGMKMVSGGATGSGRHLSAVFHQTGEDTGVTYLAYRADEKGYVHHIAFEKNASNEYIPSVLKTDSDSRWKLPDTGCGPSLADIGEDLMALIWKGCDGCTVYYQYFDKITGAWMSDIHTHDTDTNNWIPTGAVYYQQVSDSTNYSKYRYDALFYIFNGEWKNSTKLNSDWKMDLVDHAGYWWPISDTTADLSDYEKETFYLWPLVALVDSPPFALNGDTPETHNCLVKACTNTAFGLSSEATQTIGGEIKGGPYVETGKKSPITMEFSAGLSGSYDKAVTYTFKTTDKLYQNVEGQVMAFYLVPKFKTGTLEWYGLDGKPSGIFAYPIQVLSAQIIKRTFEPEVGPDGCDNVPFPYLDIPPHGSLDDMERLATYTYSGDTDPAKYTALFPTQIGTWTDVSTNGIDWEVETDTTTSVGAYMDFKIGAEVKHIIGAGIEGSFEIYSSSSVKKGVSVAIELENTDPTETGHVTSFDVTGYWLKPDANGYWIPASRKGMGDTPTFITYSVKNIHQKQ